MADESPAGGQGRHVARRRLRFARVFCLIFYLIFT
jgi:hypothetical protein